MTPKEFYMNPNIRKITPHEYKDFWGQSSVEERKRTINMTFNNSKGTLEKVEAYLQMVGETDPETYLNYYKQLRSEQ